MKLVALATLLFVAILAVYWPGLGGPFVFDDVGAIVNNPTLRQWDSPAVLSPPPGLTVSGRPLLNASFAANWAISGASARGYRATNVCLHALAALAWFGLLRRTLKTPRLKARFGPRATTIAVGAALLWALHPLQTASVTYVVQRAESLMGLFYLLTLYAFVRGTECPPSDDAQAEIAQEEKKSCPRSGDTRTRGRRAAWLVGSVAACALGMATKEVMVTAPGLVLLYDRTFVAGSFAAAWRRRWRFYAALAATWLVLIACVARAGDRAGTAGFSAGVSSWDYALLQSRALAHYVKLAVWPHPLVFDYGPYAGHMTQGTTLFAALIVAALGATIVLLRRRPVAGFVGAAFFLILAPTSSFLPIATEPVAEQRMYLPLACVAALIACGVDRMTGRAPLLACATGAAALGVATFHRNEVYRSERALWSDTAAKAPENPRAQSSLAWALLAENDRAGAEARFRAALAAGPDYVDAHRGLGRIMEETGRAAEAAEEYRAVLRAKPDDFVAHSALGMLAFDAGRLAESIAQFEAAVRAEPAAAAAHNNLACAYYESENFPAARAHAETAVRLDPHSAEAHYNLGNALVRLNAPDAAREAYQRALALNPDYAEAHAHLGVVLQNLGATAAAIAEYREALRLRPELDFVRRNLSALESGRR